MSWDVAEVAEKIDWPVDDWPGNCHAVADAMLKAKLVSGYLCYGNWWGPIAAGTLFADRVMAPHHGWIEVTPNRIVDPTRWVFEGAGAYIFDGGDAGNFYDLGGNRLRDSFRSPPPKYGPSKHVWSVVALPGPVAELLKTLFVEQAGGYTQEQIFWASNLSPQQLAPFARCFYEWLKSERLAGFIPIDNMQYVYRD
jgi:hypothetical protein